jgi:hypothetical protein
MPSSAEYMREWRARNTSYVERGRKASRAYGRASTRLIEAHPEEFDRYLTVERVAEGLPPVGETPTGRPKKRSE